MKDWSWLRSQRLEALDRDLPAQRLVAGPPHLAHAAAPDQIEQPVPALDQPGVRHRVLSPPSLVARALPRPVQYGRLIVRSLYGAGRAAGAESRHRLQDVPGRELPAQTGGNAAQQGAGGAQLAGDACGGGGGSAVQLVGVRGQCGVRERGHAPPQQFARRDEQRVDGRAAAGSRRRRAPRVRRRARGGPARSRRRAPPRSAGTSAGSRPTRRALSRCSST